MIGINVVLGRRKKGSNFALAICFAPCACSSQTPTDCFVRTSLSLGIKLKQKTSG